jgi:signal transduction histidine kinase
MRIPMRFQRSLRYRIVVTFCLFGAVLGLVFATTVFFLLHATEDSVLNNTLRQEVEHYLEQYRRDPQAPLPSAKHWRSAIGSDGLPSALRSVVSDWKDGIYEYYLSDTETEYHIAVRRLPDNDETLADDRRLYVFYEVSALEPLHGFEGPLITILLAGILLVIGLGAWLGFVTAHTVVAPVVRLAEMVETSAPQQLLPGVAANFSNDEVGTLARSLERTMRRVQDFIERERRFTRDASHELRTPVTVSRGALELLQQSPVVQHDRRLQAPLKRLDRAIRDMETIIQTFLSLGREYDSGEVRNISDISALVEHAVEQHRYLLADKAVEVRIVNRASLVLQAPEQILAIVVGNLLRNAFHNTIRGTVTVTLEQCSITVEDTGSGIATENLLRIREPHIRGEDSSGYGLGLDIVQRLCDRFGWLLTVESEYGKGTRAQLSLVKRN